MINPAAPLLASWIPKTLPGVLPKNDEIALGKVISKLKIIRGKDQELNDNRVKFGKL